MIHNEFCSASCRGVTPGGDPMPTQHTADRLRIRGFDGGDVQAQLEPGPAPRHPHHPLPENLRGQLPHHQQRWRPRSRNQDADDPHAPHPPNHASPYRCWGRRRPCRAGRNRTPRPSHPPDPPPDRHQPKPASDPTATPPNRSPSTCPDHRRTPSPTTTRPAPRSPDQSRCLWRRCSRPHSWCSSDPHPTGSTGQSNPHTALLVLVMMSSAPVQKLPSNGKDRARNRQPAGSSRDMRHRLMLPIRPAGPRPAQH